MPAVQVALLFRCWAQGSGVSRSGTLLEDEQVPKMLEMLEKLKK